VIDLRQRAALGERALPDVGAVRVLAAHCLDDHVEAGVHVSREVDDAHAALAEDAHDRILLVDERAWAEMRAPRARGRSRRRG